MSVAHRVRYDPARRSRRLLPNHARLTPDLDGLSLLFGQEAYANYHHYLLHNVLFGAVVTGISARWIGLRSGPLALVFAAYVSHLAGDYCGSGPGWPLWPFRPFAEAMFYCQGAWELVSWQNTTISAVAIAITLMIAARRGYTPLETFLPKIDRIVVNTIRLRTRTIPYSACGERAWFHCGTCSQPVCETHARAVTRLSRRCASCLAAAPV